MTVLTAFRQRMNNPREYKIRLIREIMDRAIADHHNYLNAELEKWNWEGTETYIERREREHS